MKMNTVYSMHDVTTAAALVDVNVAEADLRAVSTPGLTAENVNVYYGNTHALRDVSINIYSKQITALIGPG